MGWSVCSYFLFILSMIGGDYLLQHPVEKLQTNYNSTRHGIFHPLVMGLGVPQTTIGRMEGLSWVDSTDIGKARQLDSMVDYQGPGYEVALKRYYVSLWVSHLWLMIEAYLQKWLWVGGPILMPWLGVWIWKSRSDPASYLILWAGLINLCEMSVIHSKLAALPYNSVFMFAMGVSGLKFLGWWWDGRIIQEWLVRVLSYEAIRGMRG